MYPDPILWEYTKSKVEKAKVVKIYLVSELSVWRSKINKNVELIDWENIGDFIFTPKSIIVAILIEMKEKYSYLKKLYDTNMPFILYAPTSFLGLKKCGTLFRKNGINMDILPQKISFYDDNGIKLRPPPFAISIYSSQHFGDNALFIHDKFTSPNVINGKEKT